MWQKGSSIVVDEKIPSSITINEFGNEIVFGWGGLHGAPVGVNTYKDVKLLDVASMYPNIIININALGEYTKKQRNTRRPL